MKYKGKEVKVVKSNNCKGCIFLRPCRRQEKKSDIFENKYDLKTCCEIWVKYIYT